MFLRGLWLGSVFCLSTFAADLVPMVRAYLAQGDLDGAAALVTAQRGAAGDTPETIEALSWIARGALAAGNTELAESTASHTYQLAQKQLGARTLDAEPRLATAVGASVEVRAQIMAQRGERAEAVAYLRKELVKYRATAIRARLQKNLNLLTLTGKPAPPLEVRAWVGAEAPPPLAALRGKPLLLFFWAHWCRDCKAQAPILARLEQEYPNLVMVGPTQHYGYVAGGEDAPRDVETKYIEQVRNGFYGSLRMAVPLSEENFRNYGASTTPTLVLVDRAGIVRLYHPGRMAYEELAPLVAKLTAPRPASPGR